MRPRIKVLCIDENEQRLSRLCFALHLRGYEPIRAMTDAVLQEVLRAMPTGEIRAMLVTSDWKHGGPEAAIAASVVDHLRMRAIVLGYEYEYRDIQGAKFFLPRGSCQMSVILEKLKICTALRRGPRPVRVPIEDWGAA